MLDFLYCDKPVHRDSMLGFVIELHDASKWWCRYVLNHRGGGGGASCLSVAD